MKKKVAAILTSSMLLGSVAYADGPTVETVSASLDSTWVMVAAFLVFFMHAGFAMVESGFTRSKNTLNILMKNILTVSIGSILYFLVLSLL